MGRQPCCEKIGLKKGPWTAEEDRKLVNFITRHGHGCWRAVPKLAGLLRCGKSCRLRWTNYLRPDLKRGFLTDSEEKLIIDLHAVIGNRWSRIAAQLPGRTDNEIKNYWNTRIKKRLRQMGLDPNTHQPLPPSHASTSSVASSEMLTSNCSSTLAHAGTDDSTEFKFSGKFDDEEPNFSFDPSTSPPTKVLFNQTTPSAAVKEAFGVETMQNKNAVASRHHHLVDPHSPTSVFSHGSTEEEGEDSSSLTKNGGGSAGQALENEIESKNWMINFSLQQQISSHETQNWAPARHVLKQETSLWNFGDSINPQKERQVPCNVAAGSSPTDQVIADQYLHDWIDMPVEEAISQPYYELGAAAADGEMAGNSNHVPWLQLSDAHPSWATCQELQRLAAILDDL